MNRITALLLMTLLLTSIAGKPTIARNDGDLSMALERAERQREQREASEKQKADRTKEPRGNSERQVNSDKNQPETREKEKPDEKPSLLREFRDSYARRGEECVEGGLIGGVVGGMIGHPGEGALTGCVGKWLEGGWNETKENWPSTSKSSNSGQKKSDLKPVEKRNAMKRDYESKTSNFEISSGMKTGWKSSRSRKH